MNWRKKKLRPLERWNRRCGDGGRGKAWYMVVGALLEFCVFDVVKLKNMGVLRWNGKRGGM